LTLESGQFQFQSLVFLTNVIYLDNGEPWAEFAFTYKSMDLLQAMGVAPQTTPTLMPTQKRDREESQEDDIREENKRLKLELSRLQRQITEPLEVTTFSSEGIKTIKKVIQKEIVMVDLTGD